MTRFVLTLAAAFAPLFLPLLAAAAGAFAAPATPETLAPLVTGLRICGAIAYGPDGHVRISEWSAERVGIYDGRGRLVGAIDGIGDPSGNVFDPDGNLYVSSYSYGRVWKITPDGAKSVYAEGFEAPAGLAWIDGALVVCNRDAGEVLRVDADGRKTTLARGLPQPVAVHKMRDGAYIVSCLAGSPRILEADGKLAVLIPEIAASGINIIPDGDDAFIFCVISDGTVERVTFGGAPGARAVTRVALARGFSTPIGVARRPDGTIIFNAWGQGAAYVIETRAD